jgi:ATP-dependent DNA ligase
LDFRTEVRWLPRAGTRGGRDGSADIPQSKRIQVLPRPVQDVAACIKAENAVIDGEVVYLGGDGRPEFYNLLRRRTPQHFYAFDILWLDSRDLRRLPLVERKQILRTVVPMPPAPILYADHFDEHGVELFQTACDMDLEGIVAKCQARQLRPLSSLTLLAL